MAPNSSSGSARLALSRSASESRASSRAEYCTSWLHPPASERKHTGNESVLSFSSFRKPAETSWAIGGYEWKRHMHVQFRSPTSTSTKHSCRTYDQYSKHNAQSRKPSPARGGSPASAAHTRLRREHTKALMRDQDKARVVRKPATTVRQRSCSKWIHSRYMDAASSAGLNECSQGRGAYQQVSPWKKLVRKLKAKAKKIRPLKTENLNYDASSYEKNFDRGKMWYYAPNPSFEVCATAPAGPTLRRAQSSHDVQPLQSHATQIRSSFAHQLRRQKSTNSAHNKLLHHINYLWKPASVC